MAKFNDWFKNNLVVGPFPFIENNLFDGMRCDIVINVSDEWYQDIHDRLRLWGKVQHWFPMNEKKKDIGLNSIYGALIILYNAELENKKVYLHCHSGVNRSVAVQNAYYFMRTGKHMEMNINGFINKLVAMCSRGYLPPKAEMEKFLLDISKFLNSQFANPESLNLGGELDNFKINNINNF